MTSPADRRRFGRHLMAVAASAAGVTMPLCFAGCGRREMAPDVGYALLDGRPARLSTLRSQVVLVNFWATSCATCVQEMPALVTTWHRFRGRGYETLAVAMSHDPPALVARFAEARALPFGVVIDNTGAVAKAFGDVRVTPTTFVLDRRGAIAARHEGAPDFVKLHRLIDELLSEPA